MRAYALGLYEKAMPGSLDLAQKLACARDCGFDFLELSIDETQGRMARLDWTPQQRRDLRAAMDQAGIPIGSICLSAHRKYPLGASRPAHRARSLEIMEKAIDLAADLGIRIIQIAGYDVYYEESTPQTRADFLTGLTRSVELAARKGVVLAFETMENDFLNSVGKCMAYVTKLQSPYLGLYPDTGNVTNAALTDGKDALEDLTLGRGHTFALHLKESLPGKFREIPYGTGHVDFAGLIRTAWGMGVRRYLAEMWDVGRESWQEDILQANRFLRAMLDAQPESN